MIHKSHLDLKLINLSPQVSQKSNIISQPLLIEPHYFGTVHYIARWLNHSNLKPETAAHYLKGSHRNRLYISGPNGAFCLSIPLHKGKNEQQALKDVRISYTENWRHQHWQAICSAYNRSPYFEFLYADVEHLYKQKFEFLCEFTLASLQIVRQYVAGINLLEQTHAYTEQPQDYYDMRSHIHPKAHRAAEDSSYTHPRYHQIFQEKTGFIEGLSILDLYVMEGPNTAQILKKSLI